MPPKPTCKVVKRVGQTGARIHPKGCTVRTDVDVGAGTKVRTNKAGDKKRKVVEGGREHQVTLARAPNANPNEWVTGVIYDTGATDSDFTQAAATKLGYPQARVLREGSPVIISGTGGTYAGMRVRMGFYVLVESHALVAHGNNAWKYVEGNATVSMARHLLLGVTHIKQLKSAYSVKFR